MPLSSVLGAQSLVRPGVCTSTTRPASPFEGQVIYETDTDLVQVYNGTGWKALGRMVPSTNGSVLQVVSTTKTDTYTHSSGVTFTNVTGLSATITPTSTSNKVLIYVSLNVSGNNGGTFVKVTGGNATSWLGDAASNRTRVAFSTLIQSATNVMAMGAGYYLDSPNTVSSTTYQVQIAAGDNVTTTYVNRSAADTDNSSHPRSASTITLMEIAG